MQHHRERKRTFSRKASTWSTDWDLVSEESESTTWERLSSIKSFTASEVSDIVLVSPQAHSSRSMEKSSQELSPENIFTSFDTVLPPKASQIKLSDIELTEKERKVLSDFYEKNENMDLLTNFLNADIVTKTSRILGGVGLYWFLFKFNRGSISQKVALLSAYYIYRKISNNAALLQLPAF
eukprot:snap_masked-scaffold_7-processed-gene-11.6-mRNA-1 protein AED:1.00 eAED:1.00 QI:0/-1/0/0/-1/1/1/0/180